MLQIFCSGLLLINKVYLGKPLLGIDRLLVPSRIQEHTKKLFGWWFGAVGLAMLVFNLTIYDPGAIIVQWHIAVMMLLSLYGAYLETKNVSDTSRSVRIIKSLATLLAMALCVLIFLFYDHSTIQSWLRIGMAVSGLIGTLLMANFKPYSGWVLFAVAHATGIPVFWDNDPIVAGFQTISLLWAIGQIHLLRVAVRPSG